MSEELEGPMDILRAQKIAEDRMVDGGDWNKAFEVNFEGTRVKCEWIDPFFGLFRIKDARDDKAIFAKNIPAHVEVWT